MSITIDLPTEYETLLRQQARQANLDLNSYAFQLLINSVQSDQLEPAHLSANESYLLEQINTGLSAAEWQRYHTLIALRQAEQLDEIDREELIALSDRLEAANVNRIEALIKLAQLRQTSLTKLMDELGIYPPAYV